MLLGVGRQNEQWTKKWNENRVETRDRDLISGTLSFVWRDGEKPRKPPARAAVLRAEILTWDLPNSMKWAYSTSTFDGFMIALVKSEPRIAVWDVRQQNLGSITAPGVNTDPGTDPASFPIHA